MCIYTTVGRAESPGRPKILPYVAGKMVAYFARICAHRRRIYYSVAVCALCRVARVVRGIEGVVTVVCTGWLDDEVAYMHTVRGSVLVPQSG